jgi:hypothetical protein
MSLKRGFKAEAIRISVGLRRDLGCGPHDPLDIEVVSSFLKVPIVPLSDFGEECAPAVRQLCENDPRAFSAVTLPCGDGARIILHNDAHAPARQRSNISHEFAHILLKHPMTLPLDSTGCRIIDRDIEEEANWLGSVLLIPNAAAVRIVQSCMGDDVACTLYGVSADMLRFRVNTSGARIRVARSHR